jgi:hypothetical protein
VANRVPLPTLLSQALVAFAMELDNEFELQMPHRTTAGPASGSTRGPWLTSMAMWANFMRFVSVDGTPLRELQPRARLVNLNGLRRWRYIDLEPDTDDGVVRPTRGGRRAQEVWRPLAGVVEERWRARFGATEVRELRESLAVVVDRFDPTLADFLPVASQAMFTQVAQVTALGDGGGTLDLSALLARTLIVFAIDFERDTKVSLAMSANGLRSLARIVGDGTRAGSRLLAGMPAYLAGWRAQRRAPGTLAHHPAVLHRGGYPDGS